MDRRTFVRSSFTALAASAASLPAFGTASESSWAQQFAQGLKSQPWLAAYKSVTQEGYQCQAQLTGKWPQGLRGSLYRNGPARHEIAGFRYHHWFDGDGMLQAFRITDQGVSHQAKIIQTRKYQAEKAAGRALYPGFATVPPNPAPVTSPDLVNVANISVLPHHGKLLALWEAGSPWEIDADTLESKGAYRFSEHSAGVPFSAHPRVESDGTLWNFGYLSAAKLLVLWHIDKQGKLVKIDKIDADPISMPHDFIVTARHIVLLMSPLHYEPELRKGGDGSFLGAHRWHGDLPTRVLVVDKNDFSRHRWLELPSQWVFHFGNGWEDAQGVIRFDGARAQSPLLMQHSFRELMRGKPVGGESSHHHQYQIDTKKWTISEAPLLSENILTEFPAIDPRVSCQRHRRLTMLATDIHSPAIHQGLNEVMSFNLDSGRQLRYRYPDSQIPEEHIFVPAPGSAPETRGWVLGTAHDWQRQCSLLNVFDAEAIDAGPIATATLPYALPIGLHGKFLAN